MSNCNNNPARQDPVPSENQQPAGASDLYNRRRPPRVGVLINPLSGGNRSGLGAIRLAVSEYPQVSRCDVRTPQEVGEALRDFACKEINLVVVNGGDGTVQAVLTALFDRKPFDTLPLLTVLQSGTTSMTARDVGFRGSQAKALGRLLHWSQFGGGEPVILQRPVLKVQAPGHPTRYGMFFGAAGIYQGIQYFHRNVNSMGLRGEVGPGVTIARYLWAIARGDRHFLTEVPMAVGLDQHPLRQFDGLAVLVSTLERLFLGVHPFWGTESGPLHYTAVRARPQRLLAALPAILRGRGGRHGTAGNGFFSHNAHEIRLHFDSGFTLDGQLYTPANRRVPVVIQHGGTASFLHLSP